MLRECIFRVFGLHEKCVQLRANYNAALRQVDMLKTEEEKRKQANIVNTPEYQYLQRLIALADQYQVSREVLKPDNQT